MRERDRLSSIAHQRELAEIEAAERERIEAPIRAAEKALEQTYRELNEVHKERLVGKVPDPDRYLDPTVGPDVRMSRKDAQDFNLAQWNMFVSQHPEIYVCTELLDLLDAYCEKEKIHIVTFAMIERIVQRFADCGLLPERPAPEPEPEPSVNDTEVVQETPKEPELIDGWSLECGEPCKYTQRALDLMSSTDFREAWWKYVDLPAGRSEHDGIRLLL